MWHISGTPTTVGDYTFVIQVSGKSGAVGSAQSVVLSQAMELQVNAPGNFVQVTGLTPIGGPVTLTDQSPYGSAVNNGVVNQYSVQYYYLPDGEVEAVFNNNGASYPYSSTNPGNRDYHNTTFVVRGNEIAVLESGGSIGEVISPASEDLSGTSPLTYILQSIMKNMPTAKSLGSGISFSTPLSADLPPNTYMLGGLYPVTITKDANGKILTVQPVSATGYGSGMYYYNLGNGYYVQTTTNAQTNQLIYYLQGGSIPSGTPLVLQNIQVNNDANGNPVSITAQVAGYGSTMLSQPSAPVTINITSQASGALSTISSSGLSLISLNPNAAASAQSCLVVANGQIIGVVSGAAINAYQYVIKNNLSNVAVTVTPTGNYQVTIGSGSAQQVITFNSAAQQGNTSYQNQIDEQDGMVVLEQPDGSISVAYGSSDPADAQTLNDVTLVKDSSGDITSATGTTPAGSMVTMVAVGNLWAAIPLNPDGTVPDVSGTSGYPSITLYGQDPSTGQMNAVLTLSGVYFSDKTNDVAGLTSIVGLTANGQSFDVNVGTTFSSNTVGMDLSELTFVPAMTKDADGNTVPATDANGNPDYVAMINGKAIEVDSQGKAALEYAQQNNLQVIDFGPSVSSNSATNNLSQYYTLDTNSGVYVIDTNSGQNVIGDATIMAQINQAIGASTPDFGNLNWVSDAMAASINSGDTTPVVYIAGPTPIFIIPNSVYTALGASYSAAFGATDNSVSGGMNNPISTNIQVWANSINQAMADNGGKIPENMQALVNFMTQSIPVYDSNGNQTGTTQLAYLTPSGSSLNTGASEGLTLNSSILTNLQTQPSSSSLAGSLIMVEIDDDSITDPSAINNAVQNQWLAATLAHELGHASDNNDLETNYAGNIDTWLNGATLPAGTQVTNNSNGTFSYQGQTYVSDPDTGGYMIPPSATAQYVHSLPGVVQAFFDVILATSSAGYNPGSPYSVVTESSSYVNTYNTIVQTLMSNNSNFPNQAAALQWALGQAQPGINATVTTNQDGSLQVTTQTTTIVNGPLNPDGTPKTVTTNYNLNISNIDNPSQMTIDQTVSSGTGPSTETVYTGIGQAGSSAYYFGTGTSGQTYLTGYTQDGNLVSIEQDKNLSVQLDVPGVGNVTVDKTGIYLSADPNQNFLQGDQYDAAVQALKNLTVNSQGTGTITFMNTDKDGNSTTAAFNMVVNGNDISYTMPDGTALATLPDINGDGGTNFYTIGQTANGTEYKEVDTSGQLTGGSITKDSNGTLIISDGQGNNLTRNPDGTMVEQLTVESSNLNTGYSNQQVITVNLDASGNVVSWKDASGTHTGDSTAFTAALSESGFTVAPSTLPDLSDPSTVSQYVDGVSQQVTNQQNQQNPTDPGDPGDTGDGGGD